MQNKVKVAVLGSTGYVGMELVKILSNHSHVQINFLGSDSVTDEYLTDITQTKEYNNLPKLKNNKSFEPNTADYVFLALPHGVSNNYVSKYFNKIKIIDLSADFRLDNFEQYLQNYGNNHSCTQYLNDFVYGLPEIYRSSISDSKNIAVPGCYPTSILLPLYTLLTNNLIDCEDIIIDSKSGYSGAGKKFDIKNIISKDNLNFFNYNTNNHRHICEIYQELNKYTRGKINFSFNPHILPNFRGMMSTIYVDLNKSVTKKQLVKLFTNFDKKNPFINFEQNNNRADFFSIQNTNFVNIKIFDHINHNKIIIVSLIDNLIKGAAGQAVQCFNLSMGFKENLSLL